MIKIIHYKTINQSEIDLMMEAMPKNLKFQFLRQTHQPQIVILTVVGLPNIMLK